MTDLLRTAVSHAHSARCTSRYQQDMDRLSHAPLIFTDTEKITARDVLDSIHTSLAMETLRRTQESTISDNSKSVILRRDRALWDKTVKLYNDRVVEYNRAIDPDSALEEVSPSADFQTAGKSSKKDLDPEPLTARQAAWRNVQNSIESLISDLEWDKENESDDDAAIIAQSVEAAKDTLQRHWDEAKPFAIGLPKYDRDLSVQELEKLAASDAPATEEEYAEILLAA